jgi:hypothetical protein
MTLSYEIELTTEECQIIENALKSYMISYVHNPRFKEVSELHKSFKELTKGSSEPPYEPVEDKP